MTFGLVLATGSSSWGSSARAQYGLIFAGVGSGSGGGRGRFAIGSVKSSTLTASSGCDSTGDGAASGAEAADEAGTRIGEGGRGCENHLGTGGANPVICMLFDDCIQL